MASDIVISVAGKIAEDLVDPIWRQFQYLFCYHGNIENLKNEIAELDSKIARVQHLTEEANRNAEHIEEDVLRWLTRVREVKEGADLVFEGTKNVRTTCFHFRCPSIKSRYSLSRKASELSNMARNLVEKGKFDRVGYFASEGRRTHLLPLDFEKFESRSLTLKEVLETLMGSEVSIIGICGMAGVGKTKLVNEIAERVKLEKSFDEVAIAVVSQSPDLKRIQGELADQLGLNIAEIKDSILERAKRLSERLANNDKRILVILDDLWADLELAYLGIPIKDGRKGLKVMLTSRFLDVCYKTGAQKIIEVKVLNSTDAWLLFKETSGISDDDDLMHIAEEVAKECGGLPLAIVCIGGAVKNKKKHVWKSILRQLRKSSVTTIEGQQNLVFSRIELSYRSLEDNDYKSLLLLCCLFPEDHEIPVELLVRYVKGLPMFNEVETLNETRDRVDTIVDHLKACYLLLASDQMGKLRHVKLHDVVRDVCLSIASKGEHVYMSRHGELTEWPQIRSYEHFTAISLTFERMNQPPIGPECPRLRLLRLNCREILPNISMEGMVDLRVLDLNSFSVQSQLQLQCLTSLKSLFLEHCTLGVETSVIGRLKELEVLNFYGSTLLGFPKEVADLTSLRLLDLRLKPGHHHPYPSGTFLGLRKIEELYMGYYEPEDREAAKQSWVTEVNSFSHLTTLQIYTAARDILLQILRDMDTKKIERFDIRSSRRCKYVESEYDFQRSLTFYNIAAEALSENSIGMMLKKTEAFTLRVDSLKNLVPDLDTDGFTNLKQLELVSTNIEYVIDATNINAVPKNGLKYLESMHLDRCNLKGLCYGSTEPPWPRNLKTVNIKNCSGMTSLFPRSAVRCLVHLENLEIDGCQTLEEVVSVEENSDDRVVEFSRLRVLKLSFLPEFKGFHLGSTSQALLNQVSLPALEELKIRHINCPPLIVGRNMPNGSLQKIKSISVKSAKGVACIAKADSVKLLRNLKELEVSFCADIEVIFDLEGLNFTQGLVLLPQLDSLWVDYSPKLASIWRMFPKEVQAFQSLTSIAILHCPRIKHVLSPPSLATMLFSLEKMHISTCESMEDIIGGEEEGEVVDDRIKEFLFPKLWRIRLHHLEKLRGFSPEEDCELIFPSLVNLKILNCPQMKKFCYGKLSAQRLEQVGVRNRDGFVPIDLKGREIYS